MYYTLCQGSVCMSELTAAVLMEAGEVVAREHLCAYFWPAKGCQKHTGRECQGCFGPFSDDKMRLLDEVVLFYRSL